MGGCSSAYLRRIGFPINPQGLCGGAADRGWAAGGAGARCSSSYRRPARTRCAGRRRRRRAQELLLAGVRRGRFLRFCGNTIPTTRGRAFDRLHRLLERQAYRLSLVAGGDGRDQLAAVLRRERPGRRAGGAAAVFDDTHRTILRLYREGLIDAVRVDHVDGLADPRGYCRKLRRTLRRPNPPARRRCAARWRGCGSRRSWRRRKPARRLADRRHHRIRLHEPGVGRAARPAGEGPLTALWTA